MKKRGFGMDMLVMLVLIVFAIVYWPGRQTKRRHWGKTIVVLLLLGFFFEVGYSLAFPAQDCVPATIQRVFPQYSLRELRKVFHTDRSGTYYTNIESGWNQLSTNKLTLVFSADTNAVVTEETVMFSHPYLWLGAGAGGMGHCALAQFSPTNVILSTSQYCPGTTNYFKETLDYSNFFSRTYDVFTSKDLEKDIRM